TLTSHFDRGTLRSRMADRTHRQQRSRMQAGRHQPGQLPMALGPQSQINVLSTASHFKALCGQQLLAQGGANSSAAISGGQRESYGSFFAKIPAGDGLVRRL